MMPSNCPAFLPGRPGVERGKVTDAQQKRAGLAGADLQAVGQRGLDEFARSSHRAVDPHPGLDRRQAKPREAAGVDHGDLGAGIH